MHKEAFEIGVMHVIIISICNLYTIIIKSNEHINHLK